MTCWPCWPPWPELCPASAIVPGEVSEGSEGSVVARDTGGIVLLEVSVGFEELLLLASVVRGVRSWLTGGDGDELTEGGS